MRSVLLRFNSFLTYGSTTLAILCFTASLTNFVHKSSPALHVEIHNVDGLQKQWNRNDEAKLTLNITADLRSLFSWNTKQVFVFVAAEYETSNNALNQITLWDHIVISKEQARFQVHTSNKYSFEGGNLWELPFNLTMYWNAIPNTGFMISDKRVFGGFHLLPCVRSLE